MKIVNGEPLMDATLSEILTRLLWLEGTKTSLEQQLRQLAQENQRLTEQLAQSAEEPANRNGRGKRTAPVTTN